MIADARALPHKEQGEVKGTSLHLLASATRRSKLLLLRLLPCMPRCQGVPRAAWSQPCIPSRPHRDISATRASVIVSSLQLSHTVRACSEQALRLLCIPQSVQRNSCDAFRKERGEQPSFVTVRPASPLSSQPAACISTHILKPAAFMRFQCGCAARSSCRPSRQRPPLPRGRRRVEAASPHRRQTRAHSQPLAMRAHGRAAPPAGR